MPASARQRARLRERDTLRAMFGLVLVVACVRVGDYGPLERDSGYPTIPADTGDPADTACPPPVDADGDGWDAAQGGGADCDDANAQVHPGVVDTANEVDEDCDGVDGAAAACVPSGVELCDGADNDCDGLIDDAIAAALTTTATVALVAPLLAGGASALIIGRTGGTDGSVNVYDLDGALVVQLVGTDQSPSFGQQLASGRDLTGDGLDDLVIAAPNAAVDGVANVGRVFVFAGPLSAATTLADAVATFVGGELPGQPGGTLALLPDLTGDGKPELALSYYRHLLLYSGVPPSQARLADATATLELNTGGGAWNVTTAPDVDADGLPELVVGLSTYGASGLVARWNSRGVSGVLGAADLVWDAGATTSFGAGLARVDDTVWALAGETPVRLGSVGIDEALDLRGTGVADGGDLDGDGRAELLVSTAEGVVAWSDSVVAVWPQDVTLQTQRSVETSEDVTGDGVPDPVTLTTLSVAVLDGARAFSALCDSDGDGVTAYAGDCDDEDRTQTPLYGIEDCDGIDDDCDGVVDQPAEYTLADRPNHASGLGDLDGDGDDELASLDRDGVLHVYDADMSERGTVTGLDPLVAYPFAGVGDADADGFPEIVASAEGSVWLLPAGASGAREDLAEAVVTASGAAAFDGRVGPAGDIDGDGVRDVWAVTATFGGTYDLLIFEGPVMDGDADDADITLESPPSWDTMEVAGAGPGGSADLDGDGRDDLVVGNPRSAYGDGRAFVFLSIAQGRRSMDRAASLLLYGDPGEQMGTSAAVGGDLDDDGLDDALVGSATGVRVVGGASCPIVLPVRYEVGAEGVALADLDGDGRVEAWLADDDDGGGAGALWRVRWGESPEQVRLGRGGEALGSGLWNVGDTDGSGGADLVWRTATGGARLGGACP